jgi:hypothetical protein
MEGSTNEMIKVILRSSGKLLPIVQSALYAAKRISHAIWISHAINLVIVGEPSRTVTVSFYVHVLT